MSEPKTREELAKEGLYLARYQARQFNALPAGVTVEDLESVGGEAVNEALTKYDPASGISFTTFTKATIRSRMLDAIRKGRAVAKRTVPLQPDRPDGTQAPPPADKRALDPAAVAAARDRPKRRVTTKMTDIERSLPGPAEVAERVVALRGAMFGAVMPADVSEVMRVLMGKAKTGDLKAAQMVIDLLAPGASGVQIQTVVVQSTETHE